MLELSKNTMQLTQEAKILFPDYDKLKNDVIKLVESMKQVEVTEDSIQVNKKLISEVRKNFTIIDEERKRVKREVMKPYQELDEKVKELKQYLDEGEQAIKGQIQVFEQQQALEREIALHEMFNEYQEEYNAPNWLDFESFKRKYPKTLNKSESEIKKRRAIIEWFETFEQEYAKLKEKFPEKSVRTAILTSYKTNGFYMDVAIKQYEDMVQEAQRLEREKEMRKQTAVPKVSFDKTEVTTEQPVVKKIQFKSQKDYAQAIRVLQENNIKFEIFE